jgi:predicted O-methyltransferase YrrM
MADSISYSSLKQIEKQIEQLFVPTDESFPAALRDSDAAGLPKISITANQGQLLYLLAKISGAKRILEIGLLGGYSGMWLAKALPDGGILVTLELMAKHAEVARKNFERAGVSSKVQIFLGAAMDSLDTMIAANEEPFDLVFIDADKSNYPGYLDRALKLVKSGSLIIGDNVVKNGRALETDAKGDADLAGLQQFNRKLAANPNLEGLVLPIFKQSVDGFAIARVK